MTTYSIICTFCSHYRKNGTCTSFPKGIPDSILSGAAHYTPLDNEPVFDLVDSKWAEDVEMLWPTGPRAVGTQRRSF
ncbi:MAG TPA: hypothetical protein VIU40_04720 [Geobacteraceae bacterium]